MQSLPTGFRFVLVLGMLVCLGPGTAAAAGPPLSSPRAELAGAFECSGGLADSAKNPVLLVHGTGSTADENWSWGYRYVLPQLGVPTCTVQMPGRGLGDIQRSVEFTVYALRRMEALGDRRISVVGHSQGGIHPVWALQFWPEFAPVIEDVIAFGTPYQGSDGADLLPCETTGCPRAFWQQDSGSSFIEALNRAFPRAGPAYTSIATRTDQVATPQPESSRLAGAREIVIQDLCPGRTVEHFSLAADAVTYALVIDALTHPGPADGARIAPSVCRETSFSGVDRERLALTAPTAIGSNVAASITTNERAAAEPPLRCYADPGCPKLAVANVEPRRIRNRKRCARKHGGCHPRFAVLELVGRGAGSLRVGFERRIKEKGEPRRWVGAGRRRFPLEGGTQRLRLQASASRADGSRPKRLRVGRYRLRLESRALVSDRWLVEGTRRLLVRRR